MNEDLKQSVAKVEDQEGLGISPEQGTESAEDFREQIVQESEGEVATFSQESGVQLTQTELRVESAGLTIDSEDREALQALNTEAAAAQAQLVAETGALEKKEELSSGEIIQSAQEKIHELFSSGQQEEREYIALSSLLMKVENGATAWKSVDEIDITKVKNILELLERELPEDLSQEEQDKLNNELREKAWKEANSSLQMIDNHRFDINSEKGEEDYNNFVEEIKNLPPDAIVDLYHGLNSGGYESVIEILNSPSHGIEQRSGPTLSLVPQGSFWKGLGFKYSLRRDQLSFPGEHNPNAVVQMGDINLGVKEDVGYITTPSGSLSVDQFDAEIMRSSLADPNPALEKEMTEKIQEFAAKRAQTNSNAEQ